MKVGLFDFQETTLAELRAKLIRNWPYATVANPQAISFSAPTGAGKTIMMTALFEQLLFGCEDMEARSDTVVLWVSDMPELNEQTRLKIEGKSDRIRVRQLVTIDSSFDAERLEGGRIYFINTQKLGADKVLTRKGDGRQYSLWETFSNTAKAAPDRLLVVIDEAHRGMKTPRAAQLAQTLMQRFLLGSSEDGMVRMPLVVGLSATPQRFEALLAGTTHTVHKVYVPVEEVRRSGLLKERVVIDHPESTTSAEMSLMEEAARRWRDMDERWVRYCRIEDLPPVYPVLVIQVADSSSDQPTATDLASAISMIEGVVGRRLREGELAHTFNDCGDLDVGGRRVQRIDASRIEESHNVGVVFFKQNLSTGWDCPRAEVMMSFRSAQDFTYIAQLVGRMVRTPLARRIEQDAALNDVHLLLPKFDEATVKQVIDALSNPEDAPPAEIGSSRELAVLSRRPGTEKVFEGATALLTYRVNAVRAQSPVRRLASLGRALTHDGIDHDAGNRVRDEIVSSMANEIAGLQRSGLWDSLLRKILSVQMRKLGVDYTSGATQPEEAYQISVAMADLDREFEKAGRLFSNGLHMDYWRTQADRDVLQVKAELIVLSQHSDGMRQLEAFAQAAFDDLYSRHRVAIAKQPEVRRQHYDRLRLATAQPQAIEWKLPESIGFRRSRSAPRFGHHLYVEPDGEFRADLGTWETDVLLEEFRRSDFVAWLRNVDRQPWSLEIPYEEGGNIHPMYPDLIIARRHEESLTFDILEPHDPTRADNIAKAIGLAQFAEKHGAMYGHIELIRKHQSGGKDSYVRLDFSDLASRRDALRVTTAAQLDDVFARHARTR